MLRSRLGKKCLRNSNIFFDGVFHSIYSNLLKKLELSRLCIKKLRVSKNPQKSFLKIYLYFLVFLTYLKENI